MKTTCNASERDAQLSAAVSSAQHLLDHVARHAVEEQRDEQDQQQEEDDFEKKPAIVVPEDVSNGLEWVEEPDKRRVRSAAAQTSTTTVLLVTKFTVKRCITTIAIVIKTARNKNTTLRIMKLLLSIICERFIYSEFQ